MRQHGFIRRFSTLGLTVGLALACVLPAAAQTAQKKPNIQQIVGQFIGTFKEYPPSQKVGSFSLDQVLEKLQQSGSSGQ